MLSSRSVVAAMMPFSGSCLPRSSAMHRASTNIFTALSMTLTCGYAKGGGGKGMGRAKREALKAAKLALSGVQSVAKPVYETYILRNEHRYAGTRYAFHPTGSVPLPPPPATAATSPADAGPAPTALDATGSGNNNETVTSGEPRVRDSFDTHRDLKAWEGAMGREGVLEGARKAISRRDGPSKVAERERIQAGKEAYNAKLRRHILTSLPIFEAVAK